MRTFDAVIDIKNDQYLGAIKVYFNPEAVSMDPDGTSIYVSDGSANGPQCGATPADVQVIQTSDDKLLNPIILREGSQYGPAGIDVTPDTLTIYVNAVTSDEIFVVDTTSNNLMKTIKLGDY